MRREHGLGRIGVQFDDEHAILRYLPLTFIVHCTILDMSKPGRSCPATFEAASPKRRMEMFNDLGDLTQRVFGMQPAIAFQTAALKAAPVIAQEAADHVKEWADQSATFLKEVFAAKTPVKVAEIQTAHSRTCNRKLQRAREEAQ